MRPLLELFDELCECAPDQRAARLSEIAELDAQLAERLRAMLNADDTGTELFPHDIAAQKSVAVNAWRILDRSDSTFGAYRMVRELGAGGMGAVWLAQRALGSTASGSGVQQVAIKFMHRSGNAQLLRQFERERDALARLEHPNIARLIDAGLTPEGEPYIACEFIDGTPLVEFVRAHKLTLAARLQLIEALCEAVDYAHRRLLVHRDIKPSNVMVDRAGRVRLLDFGIAKFLDVGTAEQTRSNPVSPAYAAPEQALGQPVSTATDVFGLGLLLFELLTGQLPAQRRALTAGDMAHKISQETIEAPSLSCIAQNGVGADTDAIVSAHDWPKRLRGDLDLIVLKALKREPERRYASALALAEDLRRFRESRPIAARPDSSWYRVRRLVARNPALSTLSTLSLLMILALSIAALLYAERAQKQSVIALSEAKNAQQAAAQTKAVNDFFSARLREGRITEQAQGVQLLHKDWVLGALPKLDAELANAPEARALLRQRFGVALRDLGEREKALSTLTLAAQESTAAFGDSIETANALAELASIQRDSAIEAAHSSIDQAISMFDRLPINDGVRAERISARTTLLRIQTIQGDYAGALETAMRNITERGELFGDDSPRLAVDYSNLSALLLRTGQLQASERANDRAMALIRAQPNPPIARIAFLERSTCLLARARANYASALAACERSRKLFATALGENHTESMGIDIVVSGIHMDQGDFSGAKALLARNVQIDRSRRPNHHTLQVMRLLVYERNWTQVQAIGQSAVQTEDVVDRMMHCYALLANWMLARTDGNMRKLRYAVEQMQSRNDSPNGYRAQASAALFLALSSNAKTQEAGEQKAQAIAFLLKNMDSAAAEALWMHWIASGK